MHAMTDQQQREPASAESPAEGLWAQLGMNRSTAALLAAILLIGMGQELWLPYMPKFIQQTIEDKLQGRLALWGLAPATVIILAIGLFGTWRDFQEGVYYYLGGRIGGTLGTRRALILFAVMPLIGYGMLLTWLSPYVAFAALPFIAAYDSIAQPATLTVIGQTLKQRHRTMALSLQSIQRRIPRIIAYIAGGALVTALGAIGGVRAAVMISAVLVAVAIGVQVWMLQSHTKDTAERNTGFSLGLLRRFPPQLKRLLAADILARVAEGMPRELFIVYAVLGAAANPHGSGAVQGPGFGVLGIDALKFGKLLALQAFTSLVIYLPIGWMAAKYGSKNPYIGLTFFFFALFPIAFWWLGTRFGVLGLSAAYVIAGLREIGEPARKAMITELLPADAKTAATGLYWSVRTFSVMLAPIAGAVIWVLASPSAMFIAASSFGFIGALAFAFLFNRTPPQERTTKGRTA